MSKEEKERRCKFCGKLLIDEKVPMCKRCVLEGRNKTGQFSGIISGVILTALSTKKFIDNNSNDDMDDSD